MVATGFVDSLPNIWPFSLFKYNDLRVSEELVSKLSVPERTKSFILAIRVPEQDSIIYIISTQCLSERSARDVECLIREVHPDAVVAQVDSSAHSDIQNEESRLRDDASDSVPTSAFQVLKRCFIDKVNKEKYENVAGSLVLREIFGTSFHGHILAAKRVAEDVGSSFMVLESPFVNISSTGGSSGGIEMGSKLQGLVSSLVPQHASSAVLSSPKRFVITNEVQAQMLKLLNSHISQLSNKMSPTASAVNDELNEDLTPDGAEVPSFAQSIYPLLVDLHDIFVDVPFIGSSLAHARKMLSDVNRGEAMDTQIISEVCIFQIAVEGLRIALNNAGRLPINNLQRSSQREVEFSQLSAEDKSYALLANVLQNQAKKFKTIVATVDASNLAGLRKHWNTHVPQEVKDMFDNIEPEGDNDGKTKDSKLKRLLSDKPVVAVGAGATAIWSASSLSKAISASPFVKIVSFKVPTSLNLFLTHTQKVITFALSKLMGPSKVMVPGLASSGAKSTSVLKASLSAEKIRAVTHGIIASAEKTSLSAMRTAFYEIMRKRRARPVGLLPLATFGCSLTTCAGLVVYGDGIECAAESLPSAPSIANLGRGIQNLREAIHTVRQNEGNRINNSIESLMQTLRG